MYTKQTTWLSLDHTLGFKVNLDVLTEIRSAIPLTIHKPASELSKKLLNLDNQVKHVNNV